MAWSDVGPAAALAEGAQRVELADGRGLVVVRRGERLWAVRDVCPHQGARLSAGTVSGRVLPCRPGEPVTMDEAAPVLQCPWHGWEFDLDTGRSLVDPEGARVRTYLVKAEHGRLWVLVDSQA